MPIYFYVVVGAKNKTQNWCMMRTHNHYYHFHFHVLDGGEKSNVEVYLMDSDDALSLNRCGKQLGLLIIGFHVCFRPWRKTITLQPKTSSSGKL